MRENLRVTNWREGLGTMTEERAWTTLQRKCALNEEPCACKEEKESQQTQWMSTEILRAMRKKKRMLNKAKNGSITEEYRGVEKR